MLLNQIAAFVETARRQSVSRAADALFISQPALTARLKGLEADLGAQLFVRTPRGMRLTDAGDAFLPYAVRALETLTDGRMQVNALERGGAGRLAIGAAPAVSTYVLPSLLKRFSQGYPRVSVSVRTGHSEEILDLVLREQVMLGLVRALQHPGIISTPLYEDRLILVVEPEHHFAARGRIHMKELADEQLVQFDRTSSYHDLTAALFVTAGVSPSGTMELDNIDAAKKMVEQGFGVALLPQTSVADELEAGALAEVEIVDAAAVRRKIVAITRRDAGPPAGHAKAFLATFDEIRDELTSRRPAAEPRRAAGRPARSRARARGLSR
ncbi:MAG TPA: LysR family transcriptional regulator [Gaiellaceae bacterium]